MRGAIIWVSAGECSELDGQCGPRIKVMPGTAIRREGIENAPSVTLTDPPRVLGDLPAKLKEQSIDFVKLNREILLQYWRNQVSTREMLEGLTRI